MEAAGEDTKDTKEVDTQEEVNNRSTSKEAQEEAGEGEDGDAVPHRPQGVHDDDLEGPADTESSNYATLYVSVEATLLVNSEYNNPNLTKPAFILTSNPVSNQTPNTAKNVIHSKRDIPINKDLPIETKPNDDATLKRDNNEIQPDDVTLNRDNNTIPSNNKRVTITENNKTNDNPNEKFTKMDSDMQLDVTPSPALKYGQLESEIFAKNSMENPQVVACHLMSTLKCGQLESAIFVSNNKDIEKEVIPVKNITQNKITNKNKKLDTDNTQAKNNNNKSETKNNKNTMGNKATIPVKNNMYHQRASPLFIYEINSKSIMVNDLLKRAISNAIRHDLNLIPGHLNNVDGNCLWEAIVYNILYRECFRRKTKETHKQLRKRSLDKAQIDAQNNKFPFIESDTSQAEWDHIRREKYTKQT